MFLQPLLYAIQTIQTSKYIRDFKAKIRLELYIFNHSTVSGTGLWQCGAGDEVYFCFWMDYNTTANSLFGCINSDKQCVSPQSHCQWTASRLYIMLTLQITVWGAEASHLPE